MKHFFGEPLEVQDSGAASRHLLVARRCRAVEKYSRSARGISE
jgi:hypothetical protein